MINDIFLYSPSLITKLMRYQKTNVILYSLHSKYYFVLILDYGNNYLRVYASLAGEGLTYILFFFHPKNVNC